MSIAKREDLPGFTIVGHASYRPSSLGFIVSDCGESVSALIRRTGNEAEQAQDRVHASCEDGLSLDDSTSPGLDSFVIRCQCPAISLPAAIVAVLRAVAKCQEIT